MTVGVQLSSFLAFIIYGFALTATYEIFLKKSVCRIYTVTLASALLFTYTLFHINGGILHPYFFIVFIISITISKIAVNLLKKHLKRLRILHKR